MIGLNKKAINQSRSKLGVIQRTNLATRKLKVLEKGLREFKSDKIEKRGVIVLNLVRCNAYWGAMASLLGACFRQFGYRTYVLIDDGQLPHWDSERYGLIKSELLASRRQQKIVSYIQNFDAVHHPNPWNHRILLSHLDRIGKDEFVNFLFYSSILHDFPLSEKKFKQTLLQNTNAHYSQYFIASHHRYFGGRPFSAAKTEHMEYAALTTKVELLSKIVADYVVDQLRPDLVISLDGIYATFGPTADHARKSGIPSLIFQPNGFHDRAMFIGEKPYSIDSGTNEWFNFQSNSLLSPAKTFMENRVSKGLATEHNESIFQSICNLKNQFKRLIGLFPNLSWDGAIPERDLFFDGLSAWLIETIEWAEREKVAIVLREHPQKAQVYNRYESTIELLEQIRPGITKCHHVLTIKSTDKYSSYKLAQELDVCVLYNGTLGVEIPYLGIPVVFAAKSPYRHKKLGIEPVTKYEYFDALLNCSFNNSSQIRKYSLQTAAFQFFERSYYCPLLPKLTQFRPDNIGFSRYWGSWDDSFEQISTKHNEDWNRTVHRFLNTVSK